MKSFDDGLISDMKSFDDGCWFSTLSCFLASTLGVTRVLFSCVAFVPLLVWVENYKNKWLVWLHCGVRNLIEWRLCLSLNEVYISFSFIIYVKSDARYLSEIVVWPGWTRRGGIFFFGYGGIPWDLWSYDYVICSKDWYLAGDGWCYVTVLRWLTWFYFGSKRSTWGQGDGGMLGSWMLGINRGGVFSILGYMDLNGFSALCVWYGFGFQMVSMETLEAGFGRMRFIYKPGVYFDRLHRDVLVYFFIVVNIMSTRIWLFRHYDVIWLISWRDDFLFCTESIWSDVIARFPGGEIFWGSLFEVVSREVYSI